MPKTNTKCPDIDWNRDDEDLSDCRLTRLHSFDPLEEAMHNEVIKQIGWRESASIN